MMVSDFSDFFTKKSNVEVALALFFGVPSGEKLPKKKTPRLSIVKEDDHQWY
jgi:hypothetical protein